MTLKKDKEMKANKKIIPIFLFNTKIGNVRIYKKYLDILECDKVDLNLEYKKSINGKVELLDLLVKLIKG